MQAQAGTAPQVSTLTLSSTDERVRALRELTRPPEFDYDHPKVDDFVTRFQTDLRGFFAGALSRSGRYVPRMSSILEEEGLPQELAYLPLIESGFRPYAVSRAGAVGPWQLIPGTGRRYGLRIDHYVDERRDPVKSTEAAAHYLKDLYSQFGDWHLSLAAYNTGEKNISRILEHGTADNFWDMSAQGYLYPETKDFVPEFLAALQIAEAPQAYGFRPPAEHVLQFDTVHLNRSLSLVTIARLSGTSVTAIRELNPALNRDVTPPNGYMLRLPPGTGEVFEPALASVPASALVERRSRTARRRGTGHAAAAHAHRSHHRTTVAVRGARHSPTQRVAQRHRRSAARHSRRGSSRHQTIVIARH